MPEGAQYDAARALEAEDVLIKSKRFEIEEAALLQIATQQPMASDLRAGSGGDPPVAGRDRPERMVD